MAWQPRRYHEGGCLVIDHSASPGMSLEEAIKAGFDPVLVREGNKLEVSTLTCSHCANVVAKNARRVRARERCEKCNHYICDFCYIEMQHPDYIHVSFEAKAEKCIG